MNDAGDEFANPVGVENDSLLYSDNLSVYDAGQLTDGSAISGCPTPTGYNVTIHHNHTGQYNGNRTSDVLSKFVCNDDEQFAGYQVKTYYGNRHVQTATPRKNSCESSHSRSTGQEYVRTRRPTWVDSVISEQGDGNSPIYSCIFNMLAGCSTVGLPITYQYAGISCGIVMMVICAYLSVFTLRLLIKTGKKINVNDYERLCQVSFGDFGYYLIVVCILLYDIGSCLSYSIIMADSSHNVMKYLFDWDSAVYRQYVVFLTYILFVLPFSLGKNFEFIEKISAIAIFSTTGLVIAMAWEFFTKYINDDNIEHKDIIYTINSDKPMQLLSSLGIIAFAFVQHDQAFLVFRTLYNNTVQRYTILASLAFVIQVIICVGASLTGYLSFGSGTKADILTNYPESNHLMLGIRIMYTFTMAFTFPTAFYVVRHIVFSLTHEIYYKCCKKSVKYKNTQTAENTRNKRQRKSKSSCSSSSSSTTSENDNGGDDDYDSSLIDRLEQERREDEFPIFENAGFCKRMIYTLVLWGMFLVPSLYLTDLGFVMSLTGLISAIMIAFVLPCACHLKHSKYPLKFWTVEGGFFKQMEAFFHILPDTSLVIFGVAAGAIGSYNVIAAQF